MKIRRKLTKRQRRLTGIISIASVLVLWTLLTIPVLPPEPVQVAGSVADAPELQESAAQGETAAVQDGETPGEPGQVIDPNAGAKQPLIRATILPSPLAVLNALYRLHNEEALVRSAVVSFLRITVAFLIAALVAIPLGIAMGTYPPIKAAIEPLSGPLRYLPVSAITGLFILLFGIGEQMKITFLFVGIVVYLLPIVIECVENVEQVYLDTAYTLGASPWQVIRRVLVPAAWPGIFEACRVIYGIGWTYVILAELINAKYGLGYLITIAYKRGHIDWAYALVLVVLLLGVATNWVFVATSRRLFAWKEEKA